MTYDVFGGTLNLAQQHQQSATVPIEFDRRVYNTFLLPCV